MAKIKTSDLYMLDVAVPGTGDFRGVTTYFHTRGGSPSDSDLLMKLLHTSDWHLGRPLYGRGRYEEFEQFLQWMVWTVRERAIDVLVIAGDVFDTATPGNRAQALYYQFLRQMVASPCQHVVIVAGNHDSPAFLNAPGELLQMLDVHVIGHAQDDPAKEVIMLRDRDGLPQLIVCAVPYLRDRDVRMAMAGETIEDKERQLLQGIHDHYRDVAAVARQIRRSVESEVPVLATGHLYAAGGQTVEGDGVRDLYIGSLGQVHASIFDDVFDYVALGHLHLSQRVGGQDRIRYSGSPIAMGFGEAEQTKSLCEVTFSRQDQQNAGLRASVELIPVPKFQHLAQVRGDLQTILAALDKLGHQAQSCWVEVIYSGDEVVGDLRQVLEQAVDGTMVELLRIKADIPRASWVEQIGEQESLDDLTPMDVFEKCLQAYQVAEHQRDGLRHTYQQVLAMLHDTDDRPRPEQQT